MSQQIGMQTATQFSHKHFQNWSESVIKHTQRRKSENARTWDTASQNNQNTPGK